MPLGNRAERRTCFDRLELLRVTSLALHGVIGLYLPILLVALSIPITAYVILRVKAERWGAEPVLAR